MSSKTNTIILATMIVVIFTCVFLLFCFPVDEPFVTLQNNISDDLLKKNPIQDRSIKDTVFEFDEDKKVIGPLSNLKRNLPETVNRYDPYDSDVTYHNINDKNEFYPSENYKVHVKDISGNLIELPYTKPQSSPVYFDILKLPHGYDDAIPNYRETVMSEAGKLKLF